MEQSLKDELFAASAARARHTVWIMSDLQQDTVALARRCLGLMIDDFKRLDVKPEQIWYLGDASQRFNCFDDQYEMVRLQGELLGALSIPLCFVMGNHDMDFARKSTEIPPILPMWEEVHRHPDWHTTENRGDSYFRLPLGDDWAVYFFSDNIASDRSYLSCHGEVRLGAGGVNPYDDAFYDRLRARMAGEGRHVITASHYAYPGGNRPSPLMARLMPLPENVRAHFYGHAHITDLDVCYESAYKRMSWVDWHDVPQFDVASMENVRCAYCRTVFAHLYEDGSAGIFWRNHDAGRFEECFFTSPDVLREGLTPYRATHPDFLWYKA